MNPLDRRIKGVLLFTSAAEQRIGTGVDGSELSVRLSGRPWMPIGSYPGRALHSIRNMCQYQITNGLVHRCLIFIGR